MSKIFLQFEEIRYPHVELRGLDPLQTDGCNVATSVFARGVRSKLLPQAT